MRTARTARFYLDQPLSQGLEIQLDKPASHHLAHVLRAGVGDSVELFNGDGYGYLAHVLESGKRCRVAIQQVTNNTCESPMASALVQAISRGDRMDTSIQKAAELGVNEVQPVYSRHAISPLDASRSTRKMTHWQHILISACEQSGRCRIPQLQAPLTLREYLQALPAAAPGNLRCVLTPDAAMPLPAKTVPVTQAMLLVGPESGLDIDEVEMAKQAGFEPLRLGPRVLRTETAGPAALAILQARYGDMAV